MQRPLILGVAATAFWASNFEATRIALGSLPPLSVASLRFLIATIAILVLLIWREGLAMAPLRRNLLAYIILGILGVAGFNAALCIGLQSTTPQTAALIMATTPITSAIFDAILSRKRPSWRALSGMALSFAGVALVLAQGHIDDISRRLNSGDLVILAGSLAWAAYGVGCTRFIRGSSPLATTSWTMVFGTLALIGTSLHEGNLVTLARAATPPSLIASLWMGILGSMLAYIFWTAAIAARGVAKTAILFNLVPVFAVLIGWALGQTPALLQIIGTALTLLGVSLSQITSPRLTLRRQPTLNAP
ncbi:DMT family transporter [Thioclava kandeliae]|uniref:DMT family transporter n=1 Tax=Thioclava kandeliae TaxID=3070818 RepID=A0ABV1SF31_9RHOB